MCPANCLDLVIRTGFFLTPPAQLGTKPYFLQKQEWALKSQVQSPEKASKVHLRGLPAPGKCCRVSAVDQDKLLLQFLGQDTGRVGQHGRRRDGIHEGWCCRRSWGEHGAFRVHTLHHEVHSLPVLAWPFMLC